MDECEEEVESCNSEIAWVLSEPLKQQLKKDMKALLKNSTPTCSFPEAIQPQLSTSLALVPYVPPMERILKVMEDNISSGTLMSSSESGKNPPSNSPVEKPRRDSAYSTDSEDEDEMMNLLAVGVEKMDCC